MDDEKIDYGFLDDDCEGDYEDDFDLEGEGNFGGDDDEEDDEELD